MYPEWLLEEAERINLDPKNKNAMDRLYFHWTIYAA